MNAVSIVLGLGVLAAIVRALLLRRHRGKAADLGAVSHRWVAEQRLSSTSDQRP
jgi:hypothetical protein